MEWNTCLSAGNGHVRHLRWGNHALQRSCPGSLEDAHPPRRGLPPQHPRSIRKSLGKTKREQPITSSRQGRASSLRLVLDLLRLHRCPEVLKSKVFFWDVELAPHFRAFCHRGGKQDANDTHYNDR